MQDYRAPVRSFTADQADKSIICGYPTAQE
jgi:hypothetical protein